MATKKKSKKLAPKTRNKASKGKSVKRVTPKPKAKKNAKAKRVVKKTVLAKKAIPKKAAVKRSPRYRMRGKAERIGELTFDNTALGAGTGGQSGDTQGLSGVAETDSESVKELLEEGQSFEAEVVEGVESVPDADQGEVRTHEVPADDVPGEYSGKD